MEHFCFKFVPKKKNPKNSDQALPNIHIKHRVHYMNHGYIDRQIDR